MVIITNSGLPRPPQRDLHHAVLSPVMPHASGPGIMPPAPGEHRKRPGGLREVELSAAPPQWEEDSPPPAYKDGGTGTGVAAVAAPRARGGEEWSCDSCTFINPPRFLSCEMCHQPKPASAQKAPAAPPSAQGITASRSLNLYEDSEEEEGSILGILSIYGNN